MPSDAGRRLSVAVVGVAPRPGRRRLPGRRRAGVQGGGGRRLRRHQSLAPQRRAVGRATSADRTGGAAARRPGAERHHSGQHRGAGGRARARLHRGVRVQHAEHRAAAPGGARARRCDHRRGHRPRPAHSARCRSAFSQGGVPAGGPRPARGDAAPLRAQRVPLCRRLRSGSRGSWHLRLPRSRVAAGGGGTLGLGRRLAEPRRVRRGVLRPGRPGRGPAGRPDVRAGGP